MESDNIISHLTRDDDDEKDLMTFCMQLVHHAQWELKREFLTGSFAEMSHYNRIIEKVGVSFDKLDIDIMSYVTSRYAADRSVALPETYTGDIIRIYTDDVHPGYVRLIREKDNEEVPLLGLYALQKDEKIHGPAMMRDATISDRRLNYSRSNVHTDRRMYEKVQITYRDMVPAVHSPYWPVEATEWVTRRRPHGFPSKSVIKQVVTYGCDFVQISHNRLRNDGEWRFSFSKAELLLIESWSITQRIIYFTLWVLNKKIASSNLCSYYFKTLMFWADEERPDQFWYDHELVHSVCELVIVMMNWLKSKVCVNYFIPGNNMIDHLIHMDLSSEIDALWNFCQSRQFIIKVIDTCKMCELILLNWAQHIDCPAWIKRAFIIYQRVNSTYDNYTDLFSTNLTTDLQNALYVELSEIYRGLCFQQKSEGCVNVSDKDTSFLKSESHLLLAINLYQQNKRDGIENCQRKFLQYITRFFMRCDKNVSRDDDASTVELNTTRRSIAVMQHSLNDHYEHKYLLYSRSEEKHHQKLANKYRSEKISGDRDVFIAVRYVTEISSVSNTQVEFHTEWPGLYNEGHEFYKEWPGRSPTVNISWFIAKAYLANLYYATQRDVSLTIQTCDDIIDVYKQSLINEKFAERTFPVVLSTQWTSIYDKEIQELLGFYSLCSYVFDASSRSVYLGICPVQFALYLKVRIEMDDFIESPLRDSMNGEFLDDYKKHIDVCYCDQQVMNGLQTANKALFLLISQMKE